MENLNLKPTLSLALILLDYTIIIILPYSQHFIKSLQRDQAIKIDHMHPIYN